MDGDEARRIERLEREDLVLFVNACFACTGQREFYGDRAGQQVSVDFLHRYTLGNYRRLYARCLALGLNHFNRAMIVGNLLAAGAPADAAQRAEENALLTAALAQLPPQRVHRLFAALAADRVNNRRTRAVMRRYLLEVRDLHFDAVKYRRRVRVAVRHAHVGLDEETSRFLGGPGAFRDPTRFSVPLFRTYVEARYSSEALFRLPFSVAEGLAARQGVSSEQLLRRGQRQMTAAERLRAQARAGRAGTVVPVELAAMPLSRLAAFVCSLDPGERHRRYGELDGALRAAADRVLRRTASPAPLGRTAVIADRSYSSAGSAVKRRHPLAVALGAVYLLRRAAPESVVFWTPSLSRPDLEVTSRGQTDLATPLLAALRARPDTVVVISDGFENAPAGLADQVARAARSLPELAHVDLVHLNPVFDADNLAPRSLGPAFATIGIRDAEDTLALLGFARFARGTATLADLEAYLAARVADQIGSGVVP